MSNFSAQEANDMMKRIQLARESHVEKNKVDHEHLILIIPGEPIPKQSVRFTKQGIAYQPKELVEAKKKLKADIQAQLPAGFIPWSGPVEIVMWHFVFSYLKGHSKKERALQRLYKTTKPDMSDNLKKLPLDAMSGLVFQDDSLICKENNVEKYYGTEAKTIIELKLFCQ